MFACCSTVFFIALNKANFNRIDLVKCNVYASCGNRSPTGVGSESRRKRAFSIMIRVTNLTRSEVDKKSRTPNYLSGVSYSKKGAMKKIGVLEFVLYCPHPRGLTNCDER